MANVHPLERTQTIDEHLAEARHAANIGDGPHTVLHAQQAVCLAIGSLTDEISTLRKEMANQRARA